MTPKLNYFIVGAPKCGTTSLFYYLTQHPNVYDPGWKEANYFCTDFPGVRAFRTQEAYEQLFSRVNQEHLAVGEASIMYMYSKNALQLIHEMNPDAKIVLVLRDPVSLVHSFHSQLLGTLFESEQDFEKAWRLQETRAEGNRIPKRCKEPLFLQYKEIGLLGKYLSKVLEVFPREQVKLFFIEDLKSDSRKVYDDLLSFLELPPFPDVNLQVLNESHAHRSVLAAHAIEILIGSRFYSFLSKVKRRFPFGRIRIREKLKDANRTTVQRKTLSPEFTQELTEVFAEDIQLLAQQTGRNLDHWLSPTK